MADGEEGDRKKKKKSASKYNYSFGDVHPGNTIGHKICHPCLQPGYPVPASMGWLWNSPDVPGLKLRRGWQPGVIGKSVAKMMTFKCPRSGPDRDKNKKKKKRGRTAGADMGGGDSEPDEPLEPKPTLKVQRKGDVFTIEVNPLKDLTEIGPNEDPYVDCDPMVFKIIKKRSPEEQAKVEARKMVKLKKQRDAEIRKALAEAVEDICKCAYMDVFCNDLSAIDKVKDGCPAFKEPECVCKSESLSSLSSNATWDIEYTPPFGCFDLNPQKRRNYIHVETQYIPADAGIVETPKVKPKKPSNTSMKSKSKAKKK
ncbi:uncharacterized protein [Maniola hyperantus]|uniref:uncharacterized protein isoform X2 n=1 Tax=Aphantopus hyperantus TaxID=2795564 RepID=UPI00156A084D|nr:uncharacterized protein LOC117990439 isoform X2 [Maniola hyperantus]XP_034833772.1 uncharacterized protein LOC117990439 isoform X2 [Maniola hyperantus]